jgi:hypothetical protein
MAKLVQALKDGIPASVVRGELVALERRRSELRARPTVTLSPCCTRTDVHQRKVIGLRDALSDPDSRPQAADLLRWFVDQISLSRVDGVLTMQ